MEVSHKRGVTGGTRSGAANQKIAEKGGSLGPVLIQ